MATAESTRCVCNDDSGAGGGDTNVSLHEIVQALSVDDLDSAINAGLLHWNGCIACAIADGLSHAAVEQLTATRDARLSAMAARDRYRARQQRLQQRSELRDDKRSAASRASATPSSLPSAAAAALARAKAKAAARAKP